MDCLRCNTSNEESALFCKNCGTDLHMTIELSPHSKASDILLIIYVIVAFISVVAEFAIHKLVDHWYKSPAKYLVVLISISFSVSFILIPLAIKNKTLKIVGLIISGLLLAYWIYANIKFMTER